MVNPGEKLITLLLQNKGRIIGICSNIGCILFGKDREEKIRLIRGWEKGTPERYGDAEPSTTDKENVITTSGQPSIVLGYDWKVIPPPYNTIGAAPTYEAVRMIVYYNQNGRASDRSQRIVVHII